MSTDVYAVGLVTASVCTDQPVEDMLRDVDRSHPTGLDHGWAVHDENFRTGEPNPCPCERNSEPPALPVGVLT